MFDQIKALEHFPLVEFLTEIAQIPNANAAFSSSLSREDQVITHAIFSHQLPIRIFTLDTGRLFPETYSVLNATRERYQKSIEVFFPSSEKVENMLTKKGPFHFYESIENRKECCFIRKVEPLNRALDQVNVWITGLRAEHSENRTTLERVEWDEQRQIVKVNPLVNWSMEDVKSELKKHTIPTNSLQDKGFLSIGCQPCTRAVQNGESFRAGRWWWEDNSKKECGLHA